MILNTWRDDSIAVSNSEYRKTFAEPGVLRMTQLYIEQSIMELDQMGTDEPFTPVRVQIALEMNAKCCSVIIMSE